MNNHAYDDLMAHVRQTELLGAVAERLGWDQETMMPEGAAEQRGEEMAAMEGILHARRSDPRIGEWLAAAEAPDAAGAAQLRLIRRSYERTVKVPADLAQELARVTSVAQGIWAEARAREDVAGFLPTLRRVVELRRQEAACLAEGGDLYDALMDDYEPGATAAGIGAMFDRMRPRLVALREAVLGRPAPQVTGHFPKEGQLALSQEVAAAYGYDFTRGRIDLAVHPFSSGTGDDSRITTRVVESDPFNCLYSTIHEVGHSSYELNIQRGLKLTPAGRGVSMGVHESQSRIYENQIGRGPLALWLYGRMKAQFGEIGVESPEAFLRAVNRVHAGFIRTEADEVHYNLHIMMRFDLERALIRGDLQVGDLEAAWNARFEADFGVAVPRPSQGVLQDVHWSCGLFGYFPTYTLGNVYAGCLWKALRRDLPGAEAELAAGDTRATLGWLAEHLQSQGGLLEPAATIEAACGFKPDEAPLLDYLETKFAGLYGL
jgi:carboxypeptidase Taq